MRKLFLLIPALVLSLVTNAAVINIDNTTPNAVQAALNSAASGDIIEMAAGTYEESGNYLAFTGKELTVRAAEGAEVIIRTVCPVRLKEGAKAEFINIKFDCSAIGSYDYVIVAADDTENKRVVLTGCEFYGWTKEKAMIEATSERRLDAITIDNCYFHDCMKSVVFVENTGYNDLSITNSTFANITTSANFSAGVIDSRATSGSILVDHCTFYNVQAMNTDYAAIGKVKLTSGAVVSNCIFALSEPGASTNRTIRDVVAANNCLVYNYSTDDGYGMQSNVTKTNCVIANPLFVDAENGNYALAGDWTTMNISPARGAATDGSDLGDPRWYSAEVLPEVDFAEPYQLVGAKAKLAGKIWYDNENGYLYGDGGSNKDYGTATWKFHAEKACIVGVAVNLNSGNTSGHKLRVEVLDADGNKVDEFAEQASTLPGTLTIPAVGDYKIILHDDQTWSSAKIDNVTLSYIGGDVQAMPGTTNINDAWFSANGTRADSKISFPGSTIQEGWVKWNVAFANTGNYNVTLNVNSNNCKNYTVALVDANDANVVTPLTLNDCSTKGTPVALAMGAMEVPAGNYILKVTNATQNSDAELISVQFAPAGGAVQNIPGPIALNEAILSERAFIDGDGLHFVDAEHLWLMSEGYAKWNIHVAADGMYKFTANCNTYETSYSNLTIKVLQGGEEKYSFTPEYTYTGEKAINSPEWFLEAGDYELKLSNPANYSNGYLVSLSAAAVEGILIVDEMADNMDEIIALNGQSRKPLLKRTFKGGMYNTVCFPFNNVSDAELAEIFGAGYELLELTSATLNGNELDLHFEAVDLTANTYGRPYLIKPTQDVTNPLFNSHTIYKSTSHLTKECDAANFIGSFIAGEVPAGDQNLFLGPDNLLYFSQDATPIKGMRAYFHVKVPGAAQMIQHARIVKGTQVITSVDLVGAETKAVKTIENGQLIITIDGVRYNVMGVKIQ